MKSDFIYGRFSPLDFAAFQQMCRRMSGRTNGLSNFFLHVGVGAGAGIGLAQLGADKSSGETLAHTVPNPSGGTPKAGPSRKTSMPDNDEGKTHLSTIPSSPHTILSHSKGPSESSFLHRRHPHHDRSHSQNLLHTSSLSLSRPTYDKPNRGYETEPAVGTFESQRYLNLEATRLWDPNWEEWTKKALQDLGERWVCFLPILFLPSFLRKTSLPVLSASSCQVAHIYTCLFCASSVQLFYRSLAHISYHLSCDPVLEVCRDGLTAVNTWLGGVRSGRIAYLLGIRRKERDEQRAETVKRMKELKDKISGVLESFRSDKRFVYPISSFFNMFIIVSFYSLQILDPYRPESRKPKAEVQDAGDTAYTSDELFDDLGTDEEHQMPHRHLFRSYFFQYHLIQVCSIIIEMVRFFTYWGIGGIY